MRILHTVAQYHPETGGMQEVVQQLSERLVRGGHEVTVATARVAGRSVSHNGVRIEEFDVRGNEVNGYRGEVQRYRDFLLASRFDVVTSFAAQQWATDLALPMLDRIAGKKVFVPTGFSALHDRRYAAYFARMPGYLKRYDINVFLSDDYRDIRFARDNGVTNTVLIPNGAAEDEFLAPPALDIRKALGIPAGHRLILSVGSHTGLKGHAEAIEIFNRARLTDTTFLMIGNSYWNGCGKTCALKSALYNRRPAWKKSGKKLLVVSLDRESTVAAYLAADLFLFPSRVECSPIVLYECLASRTPFLTSDAGNAAEIIRWSGAGVLLPTDVSPSGFSRTRVAASAELLEATANDPPLLERMAACGYSAWQERFTWEKIALQYERLYRDLTGNPD
ncbi:glycosyltransferase family 4 protein [Geomonas sp. Red69]|uniref:glycosyltransferase family 4 protein n=1 Tax=Geomonas diazotrophica TaxID=2843197 RepID=UPI001C12273D|nr:glycosyltransferase family 4 protein [Geomonas diazotrophica]MBU5636456.1 glycosyltransferase family 4 protein [Geomonas diazotrophica]